MATKTIINHISRDLKLILAIWMFLDLITSDEDVEEDSKTIDNITGLIYPMFFLPISSFMGFGKRER